MCIVVWLGFSSSPSSSSYGSASSSSGPRSSNIIFMLWVRYVRHVASRGQFLLHPRNLPLLCHSETYSLWTALPKDTVLKSRFYS